MTTADKIRKLLGTGLTKEEIADKLGCAVQYVRVVSWRTRNPAYNRNWMRDHRNKHAAQ
jgi:hypothetical protein